MNDITTNSAVAGRTHVERGVSAPDAARVRDAIASAARRSSVDFDFLLAQARVESALDPRAQARTSSASGLYQFIESTWLATVKKHGGRFGLGAIADEITAMPGGGHRVADAARRTDILALRDDPQIASLMAASLAEDNRAQLSAVLRRPPDDGELYLAHFLGAGGASRFLGAMQDNPDQSAAALFAGAAKANRNVFFERDGSARSLAGMLDHFRAKLTAAGGNGASISQPGAIDIRAIETRIMPSRFGSAAPTLASTPLPSSTAPRPSMSQVLAATFGEAGGAADQRSNAQVARAYNQLKAFGL